MIYTIAHIFRKPALTRTEFSTYYETHHTRLARRTLPEFSHYRRNHVLESTDDAQCPDSFSEFAYDDDSKLQMTMAILGDSRGQALMDDELKFMDKIRNRIYPVTPLQKIVDSDCANKYVVLVRGALDDVPHWLAGWQNIDAALRSRMVFSEVGGDGAQQLHWLIGWADQSMPLAGLQAGLLERGVPVLWCARVAEHKGYPA